MTRSSCSHLLPLDLEIERSLRELRLRSKVIKEGDTSTFDSVNMEGNQEDDMRNLGRERNVNAMDHNGVEEVMDNGNGARRRGRPVLDYFRPQSVEDHDNIIRPMPLRGRAFMIPSHVLQLVEAHPFGGTLDEDPNNHIKRFVRLCDTFDLDGVSEDAKRMKLFPFSIVDEASE